MKTSRTTQLILDLVLTDRTFERVEVRGREVWEGRCLHCGTRLRVGLDGTPISRATVEHIVPRVAGGGQELSNLALACARCNHEKGTRHGRYARHDPRAAEVIARLLQRRRERWREPPADR